MAENYRDKIKYTSPFGRIDLNNNDVFWDDIDIFNNDILNNKVTKVKIFFKSGEKEAEDEKYIVGISFTFTNLINGEKKEVEHKGKDIISGMRELNINGNEFLKTFNINFQNDAERLSQVRFATNRNNQITVGIQDGEDKIIEENNQDYVLIGTFGYLKDRINCLGCTFVDKKIVVQKLLLGFLLLRKRAKNDEQFREKWEKKHKELDITFQFIWRTIQLPDANFAQIIKFCFL